MKLVTHFNLKTEPSRMSCYSARDPLLDINVSPQVRANRFVHALYVGLHGGTEQLGKIALVSSGNVRGSYGASLKCTKEVNVVP